MRSSKSHYTEPSSGAGDVMYMHENLYCSHCSKIYMFLRNEIKKNMLWTEAHYQVKIYIVYVITLRTLGKKNVCHNSLN